MLRLVYFPEGQLAWHVPHWKQVRISVFFIGLNMGKLIFKDLREMSKIKKYLF